MKLPPGWASVKLQQIGQCISGLTYSPDDVVDNPNDGLLVLRSSNIQSGELSFNDNVFVRAMITDNSLTREGDILVCVRNGSRGLIGKSALISGRGVGVAHGAFMMLFRAKDFAFAYQLFQSREYFRQVHENLGATINSINSSDFYRFRFQFPPEAERSAIAELLSTWDAAIEQTDQLIAAKQRRNDVLSNRLLFGHVRFGKRNTKTTRSLHWFSAPSDWQVVEIGKIAREVSALNGSDDGLPVLSCTKYDGLVDSLEYFDKQVFSHDTSKYKVVGRGQFAYATNHIEEGSIGYQDFVDAGLVSPIYTVFQSDSKKIDDGYFYKLLKTEKLRQIFSARTNSSVDRRGSLRWKDFARIHIPLPPLDEQREINAVLDDAKREVVLLQTEVKALKQQKRGLMQKLLTGQWRVPVTNSEVVT
ncbi:MAG: restriction endonuclease subunit S [Sulfuritalea sp.]|nr:restriction endonuclease subunit S [Sulfuritalea sp.]